MSLLSKSYGYEAWVLFVASLLYNFISGLEDGSLTMLYVELIAYFKTSSASSGWLVSLRHGAFYFCGEEVLKFILMHYKFNDDQFIVDRRQACSAHGWQRGCRSGRLQYLGLPDKQCVCLWLHSLNPSR
jgi:hypothetical protein